MNAKSTEMTTKMALPPALQNAVDLWANATTDADSHRRADLVRMKTRSVGAFFSFVGVEPGRVTPLDVHRWQAHLEDQGLSAATVYARVSRVSSWYRWALEDAALSEVIHHNPVALARPKAPKAYQTESTKALSTEDAGALLATVKAHAARSLVGKRDYALQLFYFATGMRRAEVIGLRWQDVRINGTVTLTGKIKGGRYRERQVDDTRVRDALLDYLKASGRLDTMTPDAPLWTAHDRTGKNTGTPLSSHAFAKNLKKYARWANIGDIHLHQTRHTVARLVAERDGIGAAREILDHEHESTTRVYVDRITTKKDKHSRDILDTLGA